MKKVLSNLDLTHPKVLKALKRYIDPNIINDINNRESIYDGSHNPLVEIGILKSKNNGYETIISRLMGNIEPHTDEIYLYKRDVYLLVLDIGYPSKYPDSQHRPLLYQSGKFLNLNVGDLVKFNQHVEHALFWDRRIDIATFWIHRYA